MSERMTPFHCPYCAEENLWPHEPREGDQGADSAETRGAWECRSCQRAFKVTFLGQLRPGAPASAQGAKS